MKHWTATQANTGSNQKDFQVSDLYRNEILETRIAVSKIFSDFRLKPISKDLQNKSVKQVPSKK